MDVSENNGTPKSSILIGFSIINHPFGVPLFLETPSSVQRTVWGKHQFDHQFWCKKNPQPQLFFNNPPTAGQESKAKGNITLQGINISHLGKRKIIFKMPFCWGYVSSLEGNHHCLLIGPYFLECVWHWGRVLFKNQGTSHDTKPNNALSRGNPQN